MSSSTPCTDKVTVSFTISRGIDIALPGKRSTEALNRVACVDQRLIVECIRDTDIRSEPERAARHDRHARLVEQRAGHILVVVEPSAGCRAFSDQFPAGRKGIECAARFRANEAGRFVEKRHHQIASLLEYGTGFLDELLRSGQRR